MKRSGLARFFGRTNLVRALLTLLGLIALVMAAWMIVTGPRAVLRILRFGDTDVYDFRHYPGRWLHASPEPFHFSGDPLKSQVLESIRYGEDGLLLDDLVQNTDTLAMVIAQDDMLLYEHYAQGHSPRAYSQFFSVSKSVLSALVGMAIDDGMIESVEQPVTAMIPELAQAGFGQVSLRHLLRMMSGTNYVEDDNPFGRHVRFNYTLDLERDIIGLRVVDTPGSSFRYKSGDNALLALVLERALQGRTITDYTQERLWEPLGMASEGVWSLDNAQDGLEKTWCCLSATALDLARFGRLYLHLGNLDGQQVLSADWIRASTQEPAVAEHKWPESYREIGLENYGYQWWLVEKERGDYLALGKDGQFLYVDPRSGAIIVRLGESLGEMGTGEWIALFRQVSFSIESW
jgi:CubicO group peptidase (beta-lactamase class C family)